ncbi:FG-GAP repeat protein [Haloarcula amylovorans]|uniref:FG-GAP repeat protein n=1 Tax=Haloarcula amylovorans TaxID=2562280 RepID=UPI001075F822|nr:FG-GAP repeat protein [Halomicroarcula amylolytica]
MDRPHWKRDSEAEPEPEDESTAEADSRDSVSLSRRETLASVAGLGGISLLPESDGSSFLDGLNPATSTAPADVWQQEARLTGSGEGFGAASAVSGDTALVGSPPESRDEGYAFIFIREDGQWKQEAELVPSGSYKGRDFGELVALDESTALVGDWGRVHVFTRQDGQWILQDQLIPDSGPNQSFGAPLALSGSTAIVGTGYRGYPQENDGSVLVYTRQDGQWTRDGGLRPDANEQLIFDGYNIAVSESAIAVGARDYLDFEATKPGYVYVFTRQNGEWAIESKLTAEDGQKGDNFGYSVAIEGDTLFVGAPGIYRTRFIFDEVPPDPPDWRPREPKPGAVYVFSRENGQWSQKTKLTTDVEDTDGRFGTTVAFDGERAAVSRGPTNAAYVYASRNGEWVQEAELRAAGKETDSFNEADISGRNVLVEASEENAVYVFRRDGTYDITPESSIECGDTVEEYLGTGRGDDAQGFRGEEYYHDAFGFTGLRGTRPTITMSALDPEAGDPYVILLGPDGTIVAENDNGGTGNSACFSPELPCDGEYTIVATSAEPNSEFEYTLDVECPAKSNP